MVELRESQRALIEQLEGRTMFSGNGPLWNEGNVLTFQGTPVTLRGYGDLGIVADSNSGFLTPLPDEGDKNFFGYLQSRHINLTRVWISYPWAQDLSPFAKKNGLFNLTKYDSKLWQRLRSFVAEAEKNDIFVQVTLFNGSELQNLTGGWDLSPYNPNNNNTVDAHNHHLIKSQTDVSRSSGPVWDKINKPFVRHAVKVLGRFSNVIWEPVNEPRAHAIPVGFVEALTTELRAELNNVKGSQCISLEIEKADSPGESHRDWVFNSGTDPTTGKPEVNLATYHVTSGGHYDFSSAMFGKHFSTLNKPFLVDNDGDVTEGTFSQTPVPAIQDGRGPLVAALVSAVFSPDTVPGTVGIDFLDKGINGDTWPWNKAPSTHPQYDPRTSLIDKEVIGLIGGVVSRDGVHFDPATNVSNVTAYWVDATTLEVAWDYSGSAKSFLFENGDGSLWMARADGSARAYDFTGLSKDFPYSFRLLTEDSQGAYSGGVQIGMDSVQAPNTDVTGYWADESTFTLEWDYDYPVKDFLIEIRQTPASSWEWFTFTGADAVSYNFSLPKGIGWAVKVLPQTYDDRFWGTNQIVQS